MCSLVFLWIHYCITPIKHYKQLIPAEINVCGKRSVQINNTSRCEWNYFAKNEQARRKCLMVSTFFLHTTSLVSQRPPQKILELLVKVHFDVHCRIWIAVGAHRRVFCMNLTLTNKDGLENVIAPVLSNCIIIFSKQDKTTIHKPYVFYASLSHCAWVKEQLYLCS